MAADGPEEGPPGTQQDIGVLAIGGVSVVSGPMFIHLFLKAPAQQVLTLAHARGPDQGSFGSNAVHPRGSLVPATGLSSLPTPTHAPVRLWEL